MVGCSRIQCLCLTVLQQLVYYRFIAFCLNMCYTGYNREHTTKKLRGVQVMKTTVFVTSVYSYSYSSSVVRKNKALFAMRSGC